jgi:hypothetical protein
VKWVFVIAAGLAPACATSHELDAPARMPVSQANCRIGVARFADENGVDHALDLRDFLREHGPCASVFAVSSTTADLDVVVSGTVQAKLTPEDTPAGVMVGAVAAGAGLGAALVGVVFVSVGSEPSPDAAGFVDPGKLSTYHTFNDLGTVLLLGGAGMAMAAVIEGVVDKRAIRDIKLHAEIDADVVFSRDGHAIDHLKLHDDVAARGRHPGGRPEERGDFAAHGPLYRDAMTRVFEYVAARVGDLQAGRPTQVGETP